MKTWKIIGAVVLFFAALWIWPNLVHEQLHLGALRLQGLDGLIHYNWEFPAHPSIDRIGVPHSVTAAMFFLLAPSIFSVLLIVVLFCTKPRVMVHGGLGIYLLLDLFVNLRGYMSPISDFHIFAALTFGKLIAYGLMVVVTFAGAVLLVKIMREGGEASGSSAIRGNGGVGSSPTTTSSEGRI